MTTLKSYKYNPYWERQLFIFQLHHTGTPSNFLTTLSTSLHVQYIGELAKNTHLKIIHNRIIFFTILHIYNKQKQQLL